MMHGMLCTFWEHCSDLEDCAIEVKKLCINLIKIGDDPSWLQIIFKLVGEKLHKKVLASIEKHQMKI